MPNVPTRHAQLRFYLTLVTEMTGGIGSYGMRTGDKLQYITMLISRMSSIHCSSWLVLRIIVFHAPDIVPIAFIIFTPSISLRCKRVCRKIFVFSFVIFDLFFSLTTTVKPCLCTLRIVYDGQKGEGDIMVHEETLKYFLLC